MEFLGLIAIALILCYSPYLTKIKNSEVKIKKLERKVKGETSLSKMLSEIVNKKCILVADSALEIVAKREIECTVLAVDEEWLKFKFIDKKGFERVQILRIELVERVEIIQA